MKILPQSLKNWDGGPHGQVVKVADYIITLPLTIRSFHRCDWCRFKPTQVTSGTSQVLLAGVSGGFSRGTSIIFAPPSDWLISVLVK